MFSIRQLYILVSVGYTLLLFLAMLMLRAFWYYPQEEDRALQFQQNEIHGFLSAFALRREQLTTLSQDYAIWNQSVDFTQTQNPDYLSDNFSIGTFTTQSLAATIILDRRGKPLFMASNHQGQLFDSPAYLSDWAEQSSTGFMPSATTSEIQLIRNAPHLVASTAIRLTEDSRDIHGWMILIREIDQAFIHVLAEISRLDIAFIPPPYAADMSNLLVPVRDIMANRPGCFLDNSGLPALCVNIRHSNGDGPHIINFSIFVGFLLISIIPAIIFIMLLRVIVDPIEHALKFLRHNNRNGQVRPLVFSKSPHVKELIELKNAFNQLVFASKRQQIKLQHISNTDRLTDIDNRRAFDTALDKCWRRIQRHPQSIALILVDIDYFKYYNDHYGHQAGDKALQLTAKALAGCARRSDEIAARFGGEEFALIIEVEDARALESLRHKINESIRALDIHHEFSPVSKQLTVSYGIAWIKDSGPWLQNVDSYSWVRAADSALYEAKAAGRNCSMLQMITRELPFTESPVLQKLPD